MSSDSTTVLPSIKKTGIKTKHNNQMLLHLMLLPAIVIVLIYKYLPMYGVIIAFQNFRPSRGLFGQQTWVGLKNFMFVFNMPDFSQVMYNTIFIASMKIVVGMIFPLGVALLINEVNNSTIKRGVQTLMYLPHFLSWVILSGILVTVLSPNDGIVNQVLGFFGIQPIFFLGDNKWFPFTLVVTNLWQDVGWGTIIYLAALTGVDPSLYESAYIDGANRLKQCWYITLPSVSHIVILLATLALGKVMNAGFDQVLNMYSAVVYESGDIIDTLTYRIGLVQGQYSISTAVGLFKSAISLILISTSYYLAHKFADYNIF